MFSEDVNPLSDERDLFDQASNVYRRLVGVVADGAVLFVGAGSSCRVGYPGWEALLARLSEVARSTVPDKAHEVDDVQGVDGLLQASRYRRLVGDARFRQELVQVFGPRTPQHHTFHENLLRLPFRHVLTTNYDHVLESAHVPVFERSAESFDLDDRSRLTELRIGHASSGHGRKYVHVHGSIGRPEGIVLCKEDYDERYVNDTRARSFLREMLTGHRLVFVGFSLEDEDLKYILREVAGSLGLSQPRHFILLARPDSQEQERIQRGNLVGKYQIEPLYFDNSTGDYSALATVVSALCDDVRNEQETRQRYLHIETVPTLLEDLLQDQPALQETVKKRLPGLLQQHAVSIAPENTGRGPCSGIDQAIDVAFKLVERGLPDEAIKEYETIRITYESVLTAKQRYRIDANIGNALYSKGTLQAAADAYLRAIGHYRESAAAQGLEVLAHFLRGDMATTRKLAESLCQRAPTLARGKSLWVRAQPETVVFAEVEAQVAEELRSDAEVASALSDLAQRTGDDAAFESYARAAVAAAPDWADALSLLGCAILTNVKKNVTFDIDRGLVPTDSTRASEAEALITRAIERVPASDPMRRLAGLHFNRSVARRFQGDESGAASDLREALRRDPQDPTIVLAFSMGVEAPTDIDAALRAINRIVSEVPERDQLQLARALLLRQRGHPGDLEQALHDITELSHRLDSLAPQIHPSDLLRLRLRVYSELDRAPEGREFIDTLSSSALPIHSLAALRARAELLANCRDRAVEHVRTAIRLLEDDADWFERREIALLAQQCGLYSEAVSAWESLLGAESTGSDTVHLVKCAYFAREWRKVLGVCEKVRAAGRSRREHLFAEVEVLVNSREPDRALALLKNWVRQHPRDKHVRLYLSQLALQHGQPDLAVFNEDQLPSVTDVSHAREGAALVYVLRRGPVPERALDIAYQLYRRFPEDVEAQQLLVTCVFDPSTTQLKIERPECVGRGTAARIRRDSQEARWIYVENGPDPAVTRGEYSESHDFVATLWGKRAGERIEFQGHGYEVIAVENRALRRVHEIMERYEERFPDRPLLRGFRLPENPPADAPIEEKLGEVMTELRRHEQYREQLESMYAGDQLPLASFARLVGRTAFDVVRYLTFESGLGVRADDGELQRWQAAVESLRDEPRVIIDETVLAGALVLGLLDDLPRLGLSLAVPRAALDDIRELSLNAASPRAPRGVMGLYRGKLFFHETSPEELAREVEALERVLRFIRDHCEVVGGEATLDLPTEHRGRLEEVVGAAAIDAVALAKKRNAVLWTDDLGLRALIAQLDLGVQSAWTQAVFAASVERGQIPRSAYTQVVGSLLERGYEFTRLSADDIKDLLRAEGWRTDTTRGSAVARVVTEVALMNPHNRLVVALAFILIWLQCPRRDLAREIIAGILEGIGRGRSGRLLAAFIYRAPLRAFRSGKLRSLKRMLRSWRSRDGEFRPKRKKRG